MMCAYVGYIAIGMIVVGLFMTAGTAARAWLASMDRKDNEEL